MQVIFKDAPGSSATATLVEILGKRVTVKLASGRYADIQLKDVLEFDGRVYFHQYAIDEHQHDILAKDQTPNEQPAPRSLPTPDYFAEADAAEAEAITAEFKAQGTTPAEDGPSYEHADEPTTKRRRA